MYDKHKQHQRFSLAVCRLVLVNSVTVVLMSEVFSSEALLRFTFSLVWKFIKSVNYPFLIGGVVSCRRVTAYFA